MKTEAAKTAKAIKTELKNNYPLTKFIVRSKTFAGGDSVSIDWTDGPTDSEVNKLINKYQFGNFDSSTDMYNYDNCKDDIPQVKYVLTSRNMSESIGRKLVDEIKNYYVGCENISFDKQWEHIKNMGCDVRTLIYKNSAT